MDQTTDRGGAPAGGPDVAALRRALARLPGFAAARKAALERLPATGLAHDHFRVAGLRHRGRGVLLRVPRYSHWGLPAADNLACQAAAFARAGPSGRVPALFGVLAPVAGLPFGALAVEEVAGRPPRLPDELPALADALFEIHALALPPAAARPPLPDQADPVAATVRIVLAQAAALDAANLVPAARRQIEQEIAWARDFAARSAGRPQPRCLVLTDTQPGNFLLDAAGRATAVDLEKALYGAPAIDLAHATLYPSAHWDPACGGRLEMAQVAAFYRRYLARAGTAAAARLRPWLAPMRRLTCLRTLTIFARMKAEQAAGRWSGAGLEPAFLAHVKRHIADCHDADRIAAIRAEWLDGPGLDAWL